MEYETIVFAVPNNSQSNNLSKILKKTNKKWPKNVEKLRSWHNKDKLVCSSQHNCRTGVHCTLYSRYKKGFGLVYNIFWWCKFTVRYMKMFNFLFVWYITFNKFYVNNVVICFLPKKWFWFIHPKCFKFWEWLTKKQNWSLFFTSYTLI